MLLVRLNMFEKVKINGDLNTIWKMLEETIIQTADTNSGNLLNFNHFIKVWLVINVVEASKIDGMVLNSVSLMELIKHLLVIRKEYHKSKYCEFKVAENTTIRKAIDHHMENFCSNKEKIIKSILECPFHKIVLDYLVVNNELVIMPNEVKLKTCQYMSLNYVNDNVFSGTMNEIGMEKLSLVCCNEEVLACLLKLLNLCLSMGAVPDLWKEAWVSMIPKPYKWNGVPTNTKPIALVKTSGRIEASRKKTSFLATGTFVDNTIWVRSSQAFTQYILNIVSEFFVINNISINNDKTVVILNNQRVKDALLLINESPISIAKKIHKDVSHGILGHLFDYRFLDLQVLGWSSLNPLQFSVKLHISPVNNFLAEVVKIFLENELSLVNNLPCAFCGFGDFPMSGILAATATKKNVLSVLDSDEISEVCDSLLEVWSNCIEIYTDGFLRCADSVEAADGVAAYFSAANVDIGVKVAGLLSSTLTKLQAVVLALECVPSSCLVVLYSDSQFVIDVCISEASSTTPDFHNQLKVKGHSNILDNIRADMLANETTFLSLFLPKTAISGNICYFAWDLHQLICCAHWEAGLNFDIIPNFMIKEID
ncbi:hypothetical protein G9A89_014070 [Geosiphon pyriformis]|nr:hypothetical protein G9A89_014070 [Geosiphon pyriformis]